MSEEKQNLQRQADRSRPGGGHSVLSYLAVMFAAAFVLLLLSYFMQHRANQVAIENLQATSTSAVESIQNLVEERDQLKEEVAQRDKEIAALEEQLTDAEKASAEEIQALEEQLNALLELEKLEYLCESKQYEAARSLDGWGDRLEEILAQIDQSIQYPPEASTLTQRYQAVLEILENN